MTANPPKLSQPVLPLDRASSLQRRAQCPGSRRAELGLDDLSHDSADEGTRLHAILAGKDNAEGLNLNDSDLIGRTVRLRDELMEQVFGAEFLTSLEDNDPRLKVYKEVTLYVNDQLNPIVLGHADWIAVAKIDGQTVVLVVDYKMVGREPKTRAEVNLQLRAYALAGHQAYEADVAYAAIIQPWAPKESQVTLAQYAMDEFLDAMVEIRELNRQTEAPDAPRRPGHDACRWCKARGTERCPESSEYALEAVNRLTGGVTLTKKEAQARVESAALTQIAELWGRKQMIDAIYEAVEQRARRELEMNPEAFAEHRDSEGRVLMLKDGDTRREITDSAEAFNRLMTHIPEDKQGAFQDDYLAACKPTIGGVEMAYRKATGCMAKNVKAELADALGDLIENEQNRPSLVAVKQLEDK